MSDLDWLDYLDEQDRSHPFAPDELPRRWREAYSEYTDLEAA